MTKTLVYKDKIDTFLNAKRNAGLSKMFTKSPDQARFVECYVLNPLAVPPTNAAIAYTQAKLTVMTHVDAGMNTA